MRGSDEIDVIFKKIVPKMIVLDLAIFILSLIVGFKLGILVGLILGLAFAIFNLYALGKTVRISVNKSLAGSKRLMISSYIGRYFLFALLLYFSFNSRFINAFAVIVPQFFAKIILSYDNIIRKEG